MQSCQDRTFQLLSACGLQVQRHLGQEQRTTPWDFEIRGTRVASTMPGVFMMYTETGMAVQFSAVTRGKAERGAKRFLASHGIPWNTDREECGT